MAQVALVKATDGTRRRALRANPDVESGFSKEQPSWSIPQMRPFTTAQSTITSPLTYREQVRMNSFFIGPN